MKATKSKDDNPEYSGVLGIISHLGLLKWCSWIKYWFVSMTGFQNLIRMAVLCVGIAHGTPLLQGCHKVVKMSFTKSGIGPSQVRPFQPFSLLSDLSHTVTLFVSPMSSRCLRAFIPFKHSFLSRLFSLKIRCHLQFR